MRFHTSRFQAVGMPAGERSRRTLALAHDTEKSDGQKGELMLRFFHNTDLHMMRHNKVNRLQRANRRGQTLVEYSVILMLVFLVVVAVLTSIGETTSESMVPVSEAMK
jgi:Flp pilus assembly pilin Flp